MLIRRLDNGWVVCESCKCACQNWEVPKGEFRHHNIVGYQPEGPEPKGGPPRKP